MSELELLSMKYD